MDPDAQAPGAFDVGAGFQANMWPPSSIRAPTPINQDGVTYWVTSALAFLLFPLLFVAFIVTIIIFSLRAGGKSRSDYFEPKLSVVGAGPRRDLTAVEAAIVLERPLEDVATMMLFGLIRKDKVRVLDESKPMRLQKLASAGEHAYETAYLNAIRPDGTLDRNGLRGLPDRCDQGDLRQDGRLRSGRYQAVLWRDRREGLEAGHRRQDPRGAGAQRCREGTTG